MTNVSKSISWKRSKLFIVVLGLSVGMGMPTHAQTKLVGGTDDALTQKPVVQRDPFWPVGYQPEPVEEAATEQKEIVIPKVSSNWNEAMKKVVINGVSSRASNEFFAVINGQVKSVGDTVTLSHEGTIYTWAVDSITPPGSVKLRRVSAR